MKWLPPAGCTQHSADGRYVVVQANSKDWIAYEMHATTARELGVRDTDLKARAACEAEEARLTASHRRRA